MSKIIAINQWEIKLGTIDLVFQAIYPNKIPAGNDA